MNWDAIGAVSEALSALAVLLTLGYLAVQMRQANREARRGLDQGRGEAIREILMARATDERLARLRTTADAALGREHAPFVVQLIERTGFTAGDAYALLNEQIAEWNYRVQIIPHIDELPAFARTAFEVHLRSSYGRPGVGQLFYETFVRTTQSPGVVRFIDACLARPA